MNVIKKALKEIKDLENKIETIKSLSSRVENSNIFSVFNSSSEISSMKIDVKIDEDIDENSSDSIVEGGEDTVYGQGSNPKPEDETYLNLLKKTSPSSNKKIKVKVDINK